MTFHALYNPLAGNNHCKDEADRLSETYDGSFYWDDITSIKDYGDYFSKIPSEEAVLICGGDGTLNRFINEAGSAIGDHSIYYYPAGSGNDFWKDIAGDKKPEPVCIDKYISGLPSVTVNGKTQYFINGIGYGIDGYCCEKGDELRAKSDKPINYTSIAISGLLFHFKPVKAVVTVDGEKHYFKKVWIAPTMNGRFYGGGMIPTPDQERLNNKGNVSVMIMFGSGKIKTLTVFPSIFKGTHIKHKECVNVFSGHEIEVEFDRPASLQIDGETVLNVTKYSVSGNACARNNDQSENEVISV